MITIPKINLDRRVGLLRREVVGTWSYLAPSRDTKIAEHLEVHLEDVFLPEPGNLA